MIERAAAARCPAAKVRAAAAGARHLGSRPPDRRRRCRRRRTGARAGVGRRARRRRVGGGGGGADGGAPNAGAFAAPPVLRGAGPPREGDRPRVAPLQARARVHDAPVPRAALPDARAPRLVVRAEDATLENAAFVARLLPPPARRRRRRATRRMGSGEAQGLSKVRVSTLSFEASLFVGFLLWDGEQTLRLSDDKLVALAPLRTRERINLCGRGTQPSDLAVLLGALSQNRRASTRTTPATWRRWTRMARRRRRRPASSKGRVGSGGSRTIRGGTDRARPDGPPVARPDEGGVAPAGARDGARAALPLPHNRRLEHRRLGAKDRLRDTLAYLSGFDERTGDVIVHKAARPAAP